MTPALQRWLDLLFQAPPGPPEELIAGRHELRVAAIEARRAARQHRRAAAEAIDRLGEVTHLIRNGDGR